MLTIWNTESKRSFNVRIVEKGDKYGRDMCLTHDESEPLIEFYDASYDFEKDEFGKVLGQFVSRYYMSTLAGEYNGTFGLCLDGGSADVWSINSNSMLLVSDWLNDIALRHDIKLKKLSLVG
jgi:hypothetical protein